MSGFSGGGNKKLETITGLLATNLTSYQTVINFTGAGTLEFLGVRVGTVVSPYANYRITIDDVEIMENQMASNNVNIALAWATSNITTAPFGIFSNVTVNNRIALKFTKNVKLEIKGDGTNNIVGSYAITK